MFAARVVPRFLLPDQGKQSICAVVALSAVVSTLKYDQQTPGSRDNAVSRLACLATRSFTDKVPWLPLWRSSDGKAGCPGTGCGLRQAARGPPLLRSSEVVSNGHTPKRAVEQSVPLNTSFPSLSLNPSTLSGQLLCLTSTVNQRQAF